jgi:thiamine pyrophosphokinase
MRNKNGKNVQVCMYVIYGHFLQTGPICHLWNFTNFDTIIESEKNSGANEKDPFMHMLAPQNFCLYKKKIQGQFVIMVTTAKLKVLTTSALEWLDYIAQPNTSFVDSMMQSNSFQTERYDTTPHSDHEIDHVMW